MDSPPPPPAADQRLRGLLLVALVLLLTLLWSLLSWSPQGARANQPTPGPVPTVTATVTITPTPTPPARPAPPAPAPTPPVTSGTAAGDGRATVATADGHRFRLTASMAAPLIPGRPGTLRVIAANPESVDLRLTGVTVTVAAPAAAGCSPEWLQISEWSGDRPLPAKATATVDLTAVLLDLPDVDQTACRGGAFPLRLDGTGRSAP